MRALYDKRRADDASVRLRDASTTIAIGQVCLRLIAHAGALVGNSNLVGPSGSIFASRVNRRSRGFSSSSWHHLSFPLPSEKRVRMPLSLALIERLQAAATQSSTSVYQRVRRYLMLRLLEITGGRRSEVSALTVESVRAAAKMQKPSLSLVTRKRGDNLVRLVPITRHDVRLLLDFIDGPRAILIRKTCGKHRDDGYVLISSTKGTGIRPNTITQEIFALRRSAKIEEKACAHMFRHRFITKLFIALIEQHRFETDDTFRRWLISAETFKRQVLEWTGHRSAQSLERYIHLAFNEFTGISRAVDAVRVIQSTQIAEQNLSQLEADIDAGLSVPEAISRMRRIVSDHIADFNQPS
ncbi:MAG: site-specific integrase [Hydrogenophaga sp.]|nr:site-specific integrase [Hydrogenophaga sp.]